jgi:hypothetical protein
MQAACGFVDKVLEDVQKAEESPSHRSGTVKIEKLHDQALDAILNIELQPGKPTQRKGENEMRKNEN